VQGLGVEVVGEEDWASWGLAFTALCGSQTSVGGARLP
jgi:hypothetical protein